jgi:hypothetical protein
MAGPAEEGDAPHRTDRVLHRQVRVVYPLQDGRIVLRTELDWERDVEPTAISDDGATLNATDKVVVLGIAFPLHTHAEADWAQRLHLPHS